MLNFIYLWFMNNYYLLIKYNLSQLIIWLLFLLKISKYCVIKIILLIIV